MRRIHTKQLIAVKLIEKNAKKIVFSDLLCLTDQSIF